METKQWEQRIRDEFKDHMVIAHEILGSDLGRLEYLRWQKPGTGIYGVDYVLKSATLFVSGDLGEASYIWSPPISLQWIAGCNLGYFHGKCTASEDGRYPHEWNEKTMQKSVLEYFKYNQDCKGYKAFLEAHVPLHNREELIAWCHYNDPTGLLGDDWWEWFIQGGEVVPFRTRAHLIGLKMAFPQGD